MTIIKRKRADQFAIVPNAVANDARLTFEERGVLVYLLAKPNDWNVSVKNLQAVGNIGRDKVYKILKSLEDAGYLTRERVVDDRRRVVRWDYTIHDDAVPERLPLPLPAMTEVVQPDPEKAEVGEPLPDSPVPENQDSYKEQKEQITESPLPPEGEREGDFEILWSGWPDDQRPGNRRHAEGLFMRLTPDERSMALAAVQNYTKAMISRGKPRRMITYLKDRLFAEFYDAPEIDKDGDFIIHSKRPEWSAWLGELRRQYGERGVDSAVRLNKVVRPTRWPPGHAASA